MAGLCEPGLSHVSVSLPHVDARAAEAEVIAVVPVRRSTRSSLFPFSQILVAALALFAWSAPALAERPMDPSFEISALGGIGFGGKLGVETPSGTEFDLNFQAAPLVHGIIGFRPYSDEGRVLILSYSYQWSEVRVSPESGGASTTGDLGIGYLHAGGEIDGRVNDFVHPFFGLTIGATHYTQTAASSTSWFFSGGAHAGVKVPFGEHFGLRFQGRYIGTLISSNTQLFCTSAGGGGSCLLSLDDVVGAHQGEFSGGLYVSF